MSDENPTVGYAGNHEVGALLRAAVDDVALPAGFMDGVRRQQTRNRVLRSSVGLLAVVIVIAVVAVFGTGLTGLGTSQPRPGTLRVADPGPSATPSQASHTGPGGKPDATFTPTFLPAGYFYQGDRVPPSPPGQKLDTTQTVSDRAWQLTDPLAPVIDVMVLANGASHTLPVVPRGAGPTVRGRPARYTDGPALRSLEWEDTTALDVTITAIRRPGGASLTEDVLERIAAGLVFASETPGGNYGLGSSAPAPEGALFDIDATNPATGTSHTVLYMAPFSEPQADPGAHLEMNIGTLNVATGTIYPAEGTIGSMTDNTAAQRKPGFHALLQFGEFGGVVFPDHTLTIGWVVGPVTRVTKTLNGRIATVETSGWSVDPTLRMIAVTGAPKGTVLDAYSYDGHLLYTSKVSS